MTEPVCAKSAVKPQSVSLWVNAIRSKEPAC